MYVVNEVTRGRRRTFSIRVGIRNGPYEEYHALIAYQEWANRRASSELPVLQAVCAFGCELDSQHEQVAGRDLRRMLVVSGEISWASNSHLQGLFSQERFSAEVEAILRDLAAALASYLDATDVVVALDDESFRLVEVPEQ